MNIEKAKVDLQRKLARQKNALEMTRATITYYSNLAKTNPEFARLVSAYATKLSRQEQAVKSTELELQAIAAFDNPDTGTRPNKK